MVKFSLPGQKVRSLEVVEGDITNIQSDALVTAINSGGMWFGGIDGVIQRCAGDMYHSQAAAKLPLNHLDTVVAKRKRQHSAKFEDVIFVIDDLRGPLRAVIYSALTAASNAGYKHISVPAIRMGVMAGVVEKTTKEAVKEFMTGLAQFLKDVPESSLEKITFVVYRQQDVLTAFSNYQLN